MQPGDAMPEFIWKQERFTDLDPTNTSVEDILAQAGNIASALGYGEDDGSVEQMLTDLYGRNLDMGYKMPTSRDFVESYGKLSELLKSPIATDMLYRNIGLPFDNDPENLYGYISGITDRANRIRQQKENGTPILDRIFFPYSSEAKENGIDPKMNDIALDLVSMALSGGLGKVGYGAKMERAVKTGKEMNALKHLEETMHRRTAESAKKAKESIRRAGNPTRKESVLGSHSGLTGAAIVLDAFPNAINDILDSTSTTHTYTLDKDGSPDYTERAKIDWSGASKKLSNDILNGASLMVAPMHRAARGLSDLTGGIFGRIGNKVEKGLDKILGNKKAKEVEKNIEKIETSTKRAHTAAFNSILKRQEAEEKLKRMGSSLSEISKPDHRKNVADLGQQIEKQRKIFANKEKLISKNAREKQKLNKELESLKSKSPAKALMTGAGTLSDLATSRLNDYYSIDFVRYLPFWD